MKCAACGSDDTYVKESGYQDKVREGIYYYGQAFCLVLNCRVCGRTSLIPRGGLETFYPGKEATK